MHISSIPTSPAQMPRPQQGTRVDIFVEPPNYFYLVRSCKIRLSSEVQTFVYTRRRFNNIYDPTFNQYLLIVEPDLYRGRRLVLKEK